ncbi:MAG TPA: hypothetical protein VF824_08020 [Thermoanaerobaculia bacterium]|jgi:hypothetical protein
MIEEWKERFRQIELQFFQQPPESWPEMLQKKLKDLDPNYAARHAGHIHVLNSELRLFPPIEEDDFGPKTRVRDLQQDVVEPRVQGQPINLGMVAVPAELQDVDFGDLRIGPGLGDDE